MTGALGWTATLAVALAGCGDGDGIGPDRRGLSDSTARKELPIHDLVASAVGGRSWSDHSGGTGPSRSL